MFKETYLGKCPLFETLCALERYFWFLVLSRGHTQTYIHRKVTFGPSATHVYTTTHSGQNNLEPLQDLDFLWEQSGIYLKSTHDLMYFFPFKGKQRAHHPWKLYLEFFHHRCSLWLCCRDEKKKKNRNFTLFTWQTLRCLFLVWTAHQ